MDVYDELSVVSPLSTSILKRRPDYDPHAIPAPYWLIDRVIPLVGLSVWYGLPGSFKSLLALSAGRAVAAREHSWIGQRVWHVDRPVLLIDSETGPDAQLERLEAIDAMVPDIVFSQAPTLPHLAAVNQLKQTLKVHNPSLVIVDAATSLLGGVDMNSPAMGEALTFIRTVAVEAGASLLMVHQANKTSHESSGRGQDVMGSSYWVAVADVPYRIRRGEGAECPDVSFGLGKQRRNALPAVTLRVDIGLGQRLNQWGERERLMTSLSIARAAVDVAPAIQPKSLREGCEDAIEDAISAGIFKAGDIAKRLIDAGYAGATVSRAITSALHSKRIVRAGRGMYKLPDNLLLPGVSDE